MKSVIVLISLFLSMTTQTALADKGYVGIQYALTTYSEDGYPDANPEALVMRFGGYISPTTSVELRYGVGLGEDSLVIEDTDVTLKIDSLLGLYIVKHFALDDVANLYGLMGITKVKLVGEIPAADVVLTDSDRNLSYGLGMSFDNVNIEFVQYLAEDLNVSAMSLGVVF